MSFLSDFSHIFTLFRIFQYYILGLDNSVFIDPIIFCINSSKHIIISNFGKYAVNYNAATEF